MNGTSVSPATESSPQISVIIWVVLALVVVIIAAIVFIAVWFCVIAPKLKKRKTAKQNQSKITPSAQRSDGAGKVQSDQQPEEGADGSEQLPASQFPHPSKQTSKFSIAVARPKAPTAAKTLPTTQSETTAARTNSTEMPLSSHETQCATTTMSGALPPEDTTGNSTGSVDYYGTTDGGSSTKDKSR